ncbi:MAG: hypothetical protein J6V09_07355 [Clostridia bacterium]|nr:hypothetical protein [Clostridia bacterium]
MILIINKSKKDARGLSDMFYYMGQPAQVVTPSEALSEISPIYRAVIIMNPRALGDEAEYLSRLRSYADVPIFALTDYPVAREAHYDGILQKDAYASKIFSYICDCATADKRALPGQYLLAGLDASINLRFVEYFGHAISFTRTEAMIIRTLIRLYPLPISSRDILKYAFRPARAPELANVRTHISVINKKFRELTERPLIVLESGKGYRILTPELKENLVTV